MFLTLMSHDLPMTRRRLIKTLFCSSVAMKLNLAPAAMAQQVAPSSLDFLAIGDFGSDDATRESSPAPWPVTRRVWANPPEGCCC